MGRTEVQNGESRQVSETPVGNWRPRHLSYSAVSKFTECPRDYYLSYVKGKRSPSNKGMLMGTLFGKMIEDLHNGKTPTMEELSRHHKALPFFDREKVAESDLTTVWKLLDLYAPDLVAPYQGTPEWKFMVYLPDREAVPYQIMGYLDLKLARSVGEFKTSAWVTHPEWGWNQDKVDDSDQASLYWYAFKEAEGFEPEEVRYHILGTKPPLCYFDLVTYPNMDRLLRFQDRAASLCRAIENEEFPCECGKHRGKS